MSAILKLAIVIVILYLLFQSGSTYFYLILIVVLVPFGWYLGIEIVRGVAAKPIKEGEPGYEEDNEYKRKIRADSAERKFSLITFIIAGFIGLFLIIVKGGSFKDNIVFYIIVGFAILSAIMYQIYKMLVAHTEKSLKPIQDRLFKENRNYVKTFTKEPLQFIENGITSGHSFGRVLAVGIDEENKEVVFVQHIIDNYSDEIDAKKNIDKLDEEKHKDGYITEVTKFRDILGVRIVEFGTNVGTSRVDTSNLIVRSMAGKAIAGNTGAIIAGITAERLNEDEAIAEAYVEILVADLREPVKKIYQYNDHKEPLKQSSSEYRAIEKEANDIFNFFKVIAEMNQKEQNTQNFTPPKTDQIPQNTPTMGDELERLHDLKEKKLITDYEYDKLRQKILDKHMEY